jgi:hypothetical protein
MAARGARTATADAGYCPAIIFLTLRKIFRALRVMAVGRTPNTVTGSAAYRAPDRNSSSSNSR